MPKEAEDEVQSQLATRIPKGLHRQIKLYCVQTGISVMEFVAAALEERLQQKRVTKRSDGMASRRAPQRARGRDGQDPVQAAPSTSDRLISAPRRRRCGRRRARRFRYSC